MGKIFAAILLLLPCFCIAKTDSVYVQPFEYKLAVRPYIGYDFIMLTQNEIPRDKDRTFSPNTPPSIGLGFSLNNTIISLSYGYGFDFMKGKEFGKTKAFDFQYHTYMQKFVFDVYIQRYRGFYEIQDVDKKEEVNLYPDMSVEQYGAYGQYVFNNKQYSYKAAFNRSEKQIASTGSFLIGVGVSNTSIKMGDKLENAEYDSFQFGVSGGYAYTWVLGKHWDISGSVSIGMNVGDKSIKDFGKDIKVYPTTMPRISVGYNKGDWCAGFSYVGNMVFPSLSDKMNISVHSGSTQLYFIKRFTIIPFLNK